MTTDNASPAMAAVPRCFWDVDVSDDGVMHLVRAPRELLVVTGGWGPMECWRYELPGPVLRGREPIKWDLDTAPRDEGVPPTVVVGAWPAGPALYVVALDLAERQIRFVSLGASRFEAQLPLDPASTAFAGDGAATSELFAFTIARGPDAVVHIFDAGLGLRAELRLPRSRPPRLRFCGADLVMAADGGRLTIFDTDRGALRTVAV